jgi:hypothetical protein
MIKCGELPSYRSRTTDRTLYGMQSACFASEKASKIECNTDQAANLCIKSLNWILSLKTRPSRISRINWSISVSKKGKRKIVLFHWTS